LGTVNSGNGIIIKLARAVFLCALCISLAAAMTVLSPSAVSADSEASASAETLGYVATASADGRSIVNISWTLVDDAAGYIVYRSGNASKLGKKVCTSNNGIKSSWKDKKAAVGKTYYYTVKAFIKNGSKKITVAVLKSNSVTNSLNYKDSFTAETYAYTGGGKTASGKAAKVGRVAVDPSVIPLGTWLYVEGYGLCQAADTGGSIKGNKIDLYMNSVDECYKWGVKDKTAYILE
jgi:3D (Asp-Asp-Asp) domain-containing protein